MDLFFADQVRAVGGSQGSPEDLRESTAGHSQAGEARDAPQTPCAQDTPILANGVADGPTRSDGNEDDRRPGGPP